MFLVLLISPENKIKILEAAKSRNESSHMPTYKKYCDTQSTALVLFNQGIHIKDNTTNGYYLMTYYLIFSIMLEAKYKDFLFFVLSEFTDD